MSGLDGLGWPANDETGDEATCSLLVIPSNPHPNRDWHVILEVENQSFVLAYQAEDRKDAEWMSSMLRVALEKCGARISPTNTESIHPHHNHEKQ